MRNVSSTASALVLALVHTATAGANPAQGPPRRPRVGLALGGGSAKGFAHLGVLRWFEEHHIPVDVIAGVSTGALVGGAYATGLTAAQIQQLLREENWDLILRQDIPYPPRSLRRKEDDRQYPIKIEAGLRHGFRFPSGYKPGHYIGLLLSRFSLPYSALETFDDLPIPFRCVATDMEKGETVVLDRGPLGPALRASMALPATFDPVELDGRLLSDGGILNNLPVDVARAMGADVVIAVKVDVVKRDKPPDSISGFANRAVDLMTQQLDAARLAQADLVILPDLGAFGFSDYRKSDALAERGYAAAEALAQALKPYALDDAAWADYLEAREARQRPSTGAISFVEVEGVPEAAAAQIARRLDGYVGPALDTTKLESDLTRIVGVGRYASAMYGRVRRGDGEGILVLIRQKSYAPPIVRFSLDVDNQHEGIGVNVGSRITFLDATSVGSEWRLNTSLGSRLGFATELFQPLGSKSPFRGGAFFAPRALYERWGENFYENDVLLAEYTRQRLAGGFDLGWVFGRSAQLRAGYEVAAVRNVTRVGDPSLPGSSGSEEAARARFDYDGRDKAYFPSRGARFVASGDWFLKAPGATQPFGRAEAALSVAWPLRSNDRATLRADGGASFGATPPILYQFSLGGPSRLGAFGQNAFRGPNYLLGGAAYDKSLGRLPSLLGDRLYLRGLVEVGSAFERFSDAVSRFSVTFGLVADTFFGPLFIGASVGNGGQIRVYFLAGKVVR